jgi:phosphoribosylglycinamide formyltransferase-1
MQELKIAERLRIAVFASGKGSNFEAVLNSIENSRIRNAEIVCVLSDNPNAGALEIAKNNNIPAIYIDRQKFSTEDKFDASIIDLLDLANVNFILLAGYIKMISLAIIRKYKNRIINIHPALLPKFGGKGMYGIHVHEAVIASGEKLSGATVHFVDEVYDHGLVIKQATVNIDADETPETLAAKVLKIEHKIYTEVVGLFSEGLIRVENEKVIIKGS